MRFARFALPAALALATALSAPVPAAARPAIAPLAQAVAGAAAQDETIAAFYRARGFAPIWSGEGAAERRAAFLSALDGAAAHGLPVGRYDPAAIRAAFAAARSPAEIGALEVATTRQFLRYARDLSAGIVDPRRVDPTIKVKRPVGDGLARLTAFAGSDPHDVLRALTPTTPAYTRLLREKLRLESIRAAGGWGPKVPAAKLEPGASGEAVARLRDRLVRMGYLRRTHTARYDDAMAEAVRRAQADHGLADDGVAGPATLRALNVPLEDRLAQVVLGLERQRWMNKPLEPRHVLVNLAEQHAYVVDDGKVTFDTVVVIGAETPDRRTPEFSHTMTHMVLNPYWHVPRSIAIKEYLPALRRGGARHLEVYSRSGRVDPGSINFSRYSETNFPYSLKQAPGPRNALGRVKFMFPNQWNIYLHDTQARNLFSREVRTFSHGCVRVARPLALAYHLLAPQTATPQADVQSILSTGRERRVNLEQPIGVHIVYWSAWVTPTGRVNYRGDPYGRDARLLAALRDAGVALPAAGG